MAPDSWCHVILHILLASSPYYSLRIHVFSDRFIDAKLFSWCVSAMPTNQFMSPVTPVQPFSTLIAQNNSTTCTNSANSNKVPKLTSSCCLLVGTHSYSPVVLGWRILNTRLLFLQIGSTWSNLTGVNINVDDLSLSNSKKSPVSSAPSMNQLATGKTVGGY